MKRKVLFFSVLLLVCFFVCAQDGQTTAKTELIGKLTVGWFLASTEDRLINYGPEYYDQYHLIMTFLPAAFTPV
jgi:hypothetical protein